MEELTLTGGTLLSDTKKDEEHGNQTAPLLGSSQQQPQSPSLNNAPSAVAVAPHHQTACEKNKKKECCNHDHHGRNHGAVVTLNMPASQLVQQDVPDILKALKIVTRMGSIELLQEIMQAWKKQQLEIESKSKGGDKLMDADQVIRSHVSQVDSDGHSLLHWAAKRPDGNAAFCQYWTQYIAPISLKTADGTGMTALHWACTENSGSALSIIRHLLSSDPSLLEMKDASGCTPLLIAAQYGQVQTAAYLIQKGANYLQAVDENRDTATAWACYKGSSSMLGLLVYYTQGARHLLQADAYGQLPLHLAALRGHVSVCRYIITQIIQHGDGQSDSSSMSSSTVVGSNKTATILRNKRQALDCLLTKDKNGRTPEALARHKKKPVVAAVLQQLTEELQYELYTAHARDRASLKARFYHSCWHPTKIVAKSVFSKHRWRVWLGIPAVSDDGQTVYDEMDEAPNFPFHYVLFNAVLNFIFYWSVFIPVTHMGAGVLYDYTLLHVFNMIVFGINVTMLIYTHRTDPGKLVVSSSNDTNINNNVTSSACCTGTDNTQRRKMNQIVDYWRRKYEEQLEAYAHDDYHSSSNDGSGNKKMEYQLCHTCHLARPLRSKHDKYSQACILVFDHYCPFVGTSVGLYNYKYFYAFLLSMTLYFCGHWYLLVIYIARKRDPHFLTTGGGSGGEMPWIVFWMGVYLGLHILLSGGMLVYHTQLMIANLTTNEHLNVARYNYLWSTTTPPSAATSLTTTSSTTPTSPPRRRYKNPWFHGWWGNIMDRMHPSEASYMLPEQHEGLLQQRNSNDDSTAGAMTLSSVV